MQLTALLYVLIKFKNLKKTFGVLHPNQFLSHCATLVLWKHYTSKVSCMCIYLLHGILTRNNMKLPMNVVQGTLFSRYIYCRINKLNGSLMDLLLLREEVAFLNIFPCRFILEFRMRTFFGRM